MHHEPCLLCEACAQRQPGGAFSSPFPLEAGIARGTSNQGAA